MWFSLLWPFMKRHCHHHVVNPAIVLDLYLRKVTELHLVFHLGLHLIKGTSFYLQATYAPEKEKKVWKDERASSEWHTYRKLTMYINLPSHTYVVGNIYPVGLFFSDCTFPLICVLVFTLQIRFMYYGFPLSICVVVCIDFLTSPCQTVNWCLLVRF